MSFTKILNIFAEFNKLIVRTHTHTHTHTLTWVFLYLVKVANGRMILAFGVKVHGSPMHGGILHF